MSAPIEQARGNIQIWLRNVTYAAVENETYGRFSNELPIAPQ